jgi:hypothetical protein
MMKASSPPCSEKSVGTILIALIGPITIWALHFAVVLGIQPFFCAAFVDNRTGFWGQIAVIITTVAALLILLSLIVNPNAVLHMDRGRNSRSFLIGVMRLLALLCFFGVLWTGSAAFFLPACKVLV